MHNMTDWDVLNMRKRWNRRLVNLKHSVLSGQNAAQHSVHPTGGTLRVFREFAWLEVVSDKIALSRPAHQRVTHTVGL